MGQILSDLGGELFVLFVSIAQALPALVGYIAIILLAMTVWRFVRRQMTPRPIIHRSKRLLLVTKAQWYQTKPRRSFQSR